jgi:PPE-repeat protein
MHFAVLPPEVNSGRMYAGPGAGSMLAAATAWDELANELHTTAANFESVISALISEPWLGPSSASVAAAAAPQVAWLSGTAAQATQASAQAKAAATAYETAYAMTVHPSVVAANRAQLTSLVATNFMGQNTPAIASTEVAYSEMWAQDVTAMYSYAGEAQAASQVTPFTPPEQTTNQGGVSAQGAATAQAAGTAAGHTQSAMSAVPNALQTLTSSSSAPSEFSEFSNPYDLASLGSSLLGNGFGLIGLSGAASFITNAESKITGITVSAPGPSAPAPSAPSEGVASAPRPSEMVSAGMGRADSLGRLSIPQGWTAAAPEVRLVGLESPGMGAVPAARPGLGLSGQTPLLGGAPLMAMPGRAASDSRRSGEQSNSPRHQVPADVAVQDRAETPRSAAGGRAPGAAAELREIADVLSKLAELRANGALTDTEFFEQKDRLLGGN